MGPRRRMLLASPLFLLCAASPVLAKVATIETTASLQDLSEESVKAAIVAGVQSAADGAWAMGLSWVKVSEIVVLADHVRVRVLATDVKPDSMGGSIDEENAEDADRGSKPGGASVSTHPALPGRGSAWLR